MYINRGMMKRRRTKAKLPACSRTKSATSRCGTAPLRPARPTKFQDRSILGQIAGAIIGGIAGQASLGCQFGFGTAFLKYGREYERQADLLGAQIMARAGYDPRDMANMFQTIQAKGGERRPRMDEQPPESGQPLRGN